jgi:CheY-like chemotaxis protein
MSDGSRSRKRILIVDDSPTARSLVRHELGDERFEVHEAGNGLEALAAIRGGLRPDLVTLDLEMPGLGGFATCEQLIGEEFCRYHSGHDGSHVPVVFLTASDNLADRRRGFELGAVDFVSKPFEPGVLRALVDRILCPGDRLRGLHVLIVEDSPMIRKIVRHALRDEGVDVLEAADGLEAFEILCSRMSTIDLVLTDIEMPVMNGTELCQRIRRELGLIHLPVVFLTGADPALRLEAFRVGGSDCLTKPFIKEELMARLLAHIERVQLGARLRASIAELRTSLRQQRDMAASLSHDMRAPLAGIMGFADVLLGSGPRAAEERENLELIKSSGEMLFALVEDILALSKQQSGRTELELRPIDLVSLLRRSVAMLQPVVTRKKQHLFFENRAEGPVTVQGDAESLVRVFNNLLSNASKFTPEAGTIRVALEQPAHGTVAVTVTDTGIGIPADKLGRLFDKFTSLSRKGTSGESSTGLGMSIVKEFVEAHGGQIGVTSREGAGTQFRVTLPCLGASSAAPSAPPPERAGEERLSWLKARVKGRRVLVVDDNNVNLLVAEAILARAGCEVATIESGRAALEMLAAQSARFDAVLMDMEMPEMGGLEAARQIRARGLALPVIAVTGHSSETERQRCLEAGMNDFVTKPFKGMSVLDVLVKHLPPP